MIGVVQGKKAVEGRTEAVNNPTGFDSSSYHKSSLSGHSDNLANKSARNKGEK